MHWYVIFIFFTHSLTAALDQLRVVASSTSNDPGPWSRQHQQIGQRLLPLAAANFFFTSNFIILSPSKIKQLLTISPYSITWLSRVSDLTIWNCFCNVSTFKFSCVTVKVHKHQIITTLILFSFVLPCYILSKASPFAQALWPRKHSEYWCITVIKIILKHCILWKWWVG